MDELNQNQPQDQSGNLSKKQRRRLEKIGQKQTHMNTQTTKRIGSRIIFWVIILAIIGFFVYAVAKLASRTPDSTVGTQTDITIGANDHMTGNKDAKVQLVEYADFQCPGCGAYYSVVKAITEAHQDDLAFAYRYFPLSQHPHARIMAQAAEAAGKQGKFWPMHDLIFSNQTSWTSLAGVDKVITGYATQLGLNLDQFKTDLSSRETKDRVEADYQGGIRYQVNSTPTFFLNGVKIANPASFDLFKQTIEQAITQANAQPATTTATQ